MRLILPKEHGSWAVLIAPIVAGLAAAGGGPPAAVLLFFIAALGGFLLRPPLQSFVSPKPEPGVRPSLAVYSLMALGGVWPLLRVYGRAGLLGFAVPAGGLLAADLLVHRGRRSFSMVSELSGIAVLCLGGPAAYYAARGTLNADAWCVWFLSALFFSGPVFHVKMAALQHRASSDRTLTPELARLRLVSAAYHSAALLAAVAAALWGPAPALAALPFAAALWKTWRRGASPPSRVDFRRLGYQEVGYSVLFAAAMAAGYRL
jgi:hypothetical protein